MTCGLDDRVEIAQGRIKVSLRSVGEVDVASFARPFGGGGHVKAAGLSLEGAMGDVQSQVLEAARAFLDSRRSALGTRHSADQGT